MSVKGRPVRVDIDVYKRQVEPVFVADLFDLFAGFGNVELAFKAEDDILRLSLIHI